MLYTNGSANTTKKHYAHYFCPVFQPELCNLILSCSANERLGRKEGNLGTDYLWLNRIIGIVVQTCFRSFISTEVTAFSSKLADPKANHRSTGRENQDANPKRLQSPKACWKYEKIMDWIQLVFSALKRGKRFLSDCQKDYAQDQVGLPISRQYLKISQ